MRLFEAALSTPWLIRPDDLEIILDVLRRRSVDLAALEPMLDRAEALDVRAGDPIIGAKMAVRRGGVAIVPVHGPIVRRAGMFDALCGLTSVDRISSDLEAALADPKVDRIVLHVDSPGGQAADIGEMAEKIRKADAVKPVTSYVGNQAASAGYWVAAGAREIVASKTAALGSIGVALVARDTSNRDEKEGVREIEIISSQSPDKRPDPSTDEGRAKIQALVDRIADEFIGGVAALRGKDRETIINEFGKGGMLIGADAVAAGLADRIGSFDEVVSGPSLSTQGGVMPQEDKNVAASEDVQARIAELEKRNQDMLKALAEQTDRNVGLRVESAIAQLSNLEPSARDSFKTILEAAARDDTSDNGGRFDALFGALKGLPDHGLTRETLPGERARTADESDEDPYADDDEKTIAHAKAQSRR